MGVKFFLQYLPGNLIVQAQFGIELLETIVLIYQVLCALQLAHAQAPSSPPVNRRFTNAEFPANLVQGLTLVLLTQSTQYLGFTKAILSHE